jgi:hypothetical protein
MAAHPELKKLPRGATKHDSPSGSRGGEKSQLMPSFTVETKYDKKPYISVPVHLALHFSDMDSFLSTER